MRYGLCARARALLAIGTIGVTALGACSGDKGEKGDPGDQGLPGRIGTMGMDGQMGTDGLTSLIAIADEPAGANCPYGGDRVDSGVDANKDNILQTGEISASAYVCNGVPAVLDGNFIIHEPADIAQLTGVAFVRGNISIIPNVASGTTGVALGNIFLPDLLEVTGDIRIESNPGLTGIFFNKLVRIGGSMLLDDNPDLTAFDIGSCTDINGELLISGTPDLKYLNLGSISNVGGDYIATTGSRPGPGAVLNLHVPAFIGGDAQLSNMGGLIAAQVENVLIVGGDLIFHENLDLQYLLTNTQTYVGHDVYITDNPILPSFFVDSFLATVNLGGRGVVSGNAPF